MKNAKAKGKNTYWYSKWSKEGVKQRRVLRQLHAKAQLEGRKVTKADKLAAGLRPKRSDKADPWKSLTPFQKKVALARSKAHALFQLSVGIPKRDIYGPWSILEWGSKWHDQRTKVSEVE